MGAKIFDVQLLLWLALALALAGSLKHLATIFASVDGNTFMGWLQAIAIDAGLFALAYSIRGRKVANRSTKPLWFGVILFSAISTYGNLAYGLLAVDGNLPTWIVATKPYILAGSLPILVLFLSELLSDNRQHAAKMAERKEQKRQKESGKSEVDISIKKTKVSANSSRSAAKAERKRQLVALHAQNPHATVTDFANHLGVSRGTVRNYADELGIELATTGNGKG
jgi:hypothetical protein